MPKSEPDGVYNVHHFVDEDFIAGKAPGLYVDAGLLEIEEMVEDVRNALNDLKGGDTTADPEGIADRWRDRVERGLRLLDVFMQLRNMNPSSVESGELHLRASRIVEEQGDDKE